MTAGLLRDDLLSLPGVERAELDGDGTNPTGVRLRLSSGVDPMTIGEEVRRVLAAHGLRSEVVGAPLEAAETVAETAPSLLDETEPEVAAAAQTSEPSGEREWAEPVAPTPVAVHLDSLAIVEARDGTTVIASGAGGDSSVEAASASRAAVDQAIVSAVARLAGVVALPLVRSIDEREIGDTIVATVVIDAGGERLVGSAVVSGGWPYALGCAAWAAFSSRVASGGIS